MAYWARKFHLTGWCLAHLLKSEIPVYALIMFYGGFRIKRLAAAVEKVVMGIETEGKCATCVPQKETGAEGICVTPSAPETYGDKNYGGGGSRTPVRKCQSKDVYMRSLFFESRSDRLQQTGYAQSQSQF